MRVTVLGAGICGCAAAALLAEAGADVVVVEPDGVAAGASGRNQGLVQHPLDEALTPLYARSLELHGLADRPADGLLLLSADDVALDAEAQDLTARFGSEVTIERLERARDAEPAVAEALGAVRVDTGIVVGPAAVTQAWWGRARAAGATLVGDRRQAGGGDAVLVCTGAATPGITPLWGVVVDVGRRPTGHALEAVGVGAIARPGGAPPAIFTLVGTGVGSCFALAPPDAHAVAATLHRGAARYVPELAEAPIAGVRMCPRPLSPDGRPVIGPVDERVHVLSGHGPWGVTLGPASAELAVRALLHGEPVPEPYAAARLPGAALDALAALAG